MSFWLKAFCVVLVFGSLFGSASSRGLIDTLDRGPKTGSSIPHSLHAVDQQGDERDFKSLVGERGLILHFYRPMVLCPTCEIQASDWSARATEFRAIGYEIVAVSNDVEDILAQVAKRRKIDFPLLADPDSGIISAFGLLDDRYGHDSAWHGVAIPMTFVIDTRGVITHRFSSADYRDRADVGDVLELLRGTTDR